MSRKMYSRSTQHLIAPAAFLASAISACGQQEGGDALQPHDVQSIRSALTYTAPDQYNKGVPFFTTTGIECYQNGYDYVCAVNLKLAHIQTVHGTKVFPQSFELHTAWDYWNSASATDPYYGGGRKVIAVNTSFFGHVPGSTSPREISFPYKRNGILLTAGTDCSGARGKIRNLHVWPDRQYAAIGSMGCSSADFAALESYGSAPHVIGGLHPTFLKRASETIGRTFFGVRDGDREGYGFCETLFIYSSKYATQAHAEQEVRSFGADEVMMFDGSDSSQLIVDNVKKVSNSRLLPNALIVYAP